MAFPARRRETAFERFAHETLEARDQLIGAGLVVVRLGVAAAIWLIVAWLALMALHAFTGISLFGI